jgi:hypothetical protein
MNCINNIKIYIIIDIINNLSVGSFFTSMVIIKNNLFVKFAIFLAIYFLTNLTFIVFPFDWIHINHLIIKNNKINKIKI